MENNSMIQLIEKLDGTSIQMDSEMNSGQKKTSPRALVSQPFVGSKPDFEGGASIMNSSLNQYSKKDRKPNRNGS